MNNTLDTSYTLYAHINKLNNKIYFGITKQKPSSRWRNNGNGYSKNPLFWNAINKYGWNNFKHQILCVHLSREEAIYLEKYFIIKYNANKKAYGYNMTTGGDGTCGYKIPKESVERRAALKRSIPLSNDHRLKISKANTGKRASIETRKKLSDSHKGKRLTDKQKEIALKNIKRDKPIYCIDKDGNRLDFNSIKEASIFFNSNFLNKNFKAISSNNKFYLNHYWYYKEVS